MLVNLVYTDGDARKYAVVYHQTTGDCTFGWRFTDSTGTMIEICKDTCEFIQADPFARVQLLLGCERGPGVY